MQNTEIARRLEEVAGIGSFHPLIQISGSNRATLWASLL
jgi:hypothetical protein